MELVISTSKLKAEVLKSKETYLKTQKKARQLFAEKVMAYAEYVAKCVANDTPIVKHQPYLVADDLTTFENALQGLDLHTTKTVRIGSQELADLRKGIAYAVTRSTQAIEELAALSYIA
jgi:hypothetical protein